jgi:hypothetical protein
MRLHLSAIGKLRHGAERELVCCYLDRAQKLGRGIGVASILVHELDESKAPSADLRRKEESRRLLASLPSNTFTIALDELGKPLPSSGLAAYLKARSDSGCRRSCIPDRRSRWPKPGPRLPGQAHPEPRSDDLAPPPGPRHARRADLPLGYHFAQSSLRTAIALLITIPGINALSSRGILAEIGTDMRRFDAKIETCHKR